MKIFNATVRCFGEYCDFQAVSFDIDHQGRISLISDTIIY